jgi:NADPH:quinone reductase-like Zn-dependent oxidoreductase
MKWPVSSPLSVTASMIWQWVTKSPAFPAESPNDYPVYGELIVLPRTALTRYPDVLSPIEASVHYTPLLIAYFAYADLARVKPGQFALVTDASHCAGPSFVQLGKALGVRVIAATKSADEREYLLSLGAEKGHRHRRRRSADADQQDHRQPRR